MRVLFIGGTGNLSRDCTLRALSLGIEVFHLNRGNNPSDVPPGVVSLVGDIRDPESARRAIDGLSFDAVVDFIAFLPAHVRADLGLFAGRCAQYVFISSASIYTKPVATRFITEDSAVGNPHLQYAADKIACERELRSAPMPVTVIRPSHTYSQRWIPSPLFSGDFTVAARILAGRQVIVPGDGEMLWTLTQTRDFAVGLVGLLGNEAAYGETVNITSDEALSWNAISREVAAALSEACPGIAGAAPIEARTVGIPMEFVASVDAEAGGKLLGDKGYTSLFDCSKIRRLVPAFKPAIPFARGVRESVAWFMADPARQKVNAALDMTMDRILDSWARKDA